MKKIPVDSDLYTLVDQIHLSSEDKDHIRRFLDNAEKENEREVNLK